MALERCDRFQEATRRPSRRWQPPAHRQASVGQELWLALTRARCHRARARRLQGGRQGRRLARLQRGAPWMCGHRTRRSNRAGLSTGAAGATEPWIWRSRNHWLIRPDLIHQDHLLSIQSSQKSFDGEEQLMDGYRHTLGECELEVGQCREAAARRWRRALVPQLRLGAPG